MLKLKYIYLATLLLTLSFCGCSQEERKFIVGVSSCSTDNWREQMHQEMLQELAFYRDISLEFKIAESDDSLQMQQIDSFVKQRVDLLIIIPSKAELITQSVNNAYDSGIKTIIIDNKQTLNRYSAFLGVDNVEIGRRAAEHIATLIPKRTQVIEITGRQYTTVAKDRHRGFVSALSKSDNLELLCSTDAQWEEHSAQRITDSLLRLYPQTELIFAHNDEMAYGAYLATKELSLEHKVKIVGVDALAGEGNGIDLVSRGILEASFLYPTFGNIVMQRAYQILHSIPYPRETRFETAMINGVNAHIELLKIEQLRELDRRINILNTDLSNHERTNELQRTLLIIISIVVVVAIVVAIIIIRMAITKSQLNRKLKRQNSEISQQRDKLIELTHNLEEATSAKLLFYTNISHDLRTPLTLVADPINYILESPQLSVDEQHSLLNIASRNTSILLRLIEQILDFRRCEHNKMELNLEVCDIAQLLREWSLNFCTTLERGGRKIELSISPEISYEMALDREKMERLYFNVLSNAIKYSIEASTIEVYLEPLSSDPSLQILLTIKNRCKELAPDSIENIFERFYQVDSSAQGAGIGLAITKAYVELHGGEIHASIDGNTFILSITLPRKRGINISQPKIKRSDIDVTPINLNVNNEQSICEGVIVIVDDNPDIREYLRELLKPNYTIFEAADGVEGLEIAEREIPDLIISDIMMNRMDGIELCNQIKSRLLTCHIPVLMLTACAADEQRIEGYISGADGYISKPFNFNILKARVANLITNRRVIKQSNTPKPSIREGATDMEERFMERFTRYVEENMTNSQLSVDDVGEALNYSRSQLHRKVKALTGEAPVKLIRNARLQRAQQLLSQGEKSISQIAYDVGFNSPSYFTKCFKEYFGVSPTTKSDI